MSRPLRSATSGAEAPSHIGVAGEARANVLGKAKLADAKRDLCLMAADAWMRSGTAADFAAARVALVEWVSAERTAGMVRG